VWSNCWRFCFAASSSSSSTTTISAADDTWRRLTSWCTCVFYKLVSASVQNPVIPTNPSTDPNLHLVLLVLPCLVPFRSLTLCAVLYCILLKAAHPQLAAAAAAQRSAPRQLHTAAEVVAAARKKVSATWQQGVAHMGPGLQVRHGCLAEGLTGESLLGQLCERLGEGVAVA
jgi:hypothetical protein